MILLELFMEGRYLEWTPLILAVHWYAIQEGGHGA
jgi:hypothetical protein